MPYRSRHILAFLFHELEGQDFSGTSWRDSSPEERQFALNLLTSANAVEDQDVSFFEEEDELYSSAYQKEECDPVYEDFIGQKTNYHVSYEYVCNVLDYEDAHPGSTKEAIVRRFAQVRDRSYLRRFREYREQLGTQRDKICRVAEFVKKQFDDARDLGIIVHDTTLRMWALWKARELQIPLENFKASHWWVNKFKRMYRISSRKITKFVSFNHQRNWEDIQSAAAALIQDYMVNVRTQVDPNSTYNTDQSGFSYNVHTNRTLSHTGETVTVAAVKTLNALTHSYTIQPLVNMRGELVGKLYVNLKEARNEFGPIVAQNLPNHSNLYVTCSTSGKLTKQLVRQWADNVFRDSVCRVNSQKSVLYVDSWGGGAQRLRAVPNSRERN